MLPGSWLLPVLRIKFHPRTGMNHMEAPIQAIVIITRALFLVRRLRYRSGDVIDQYLSSDKMDKLKMEAVEAV